MINMTLLHQFTMFTNYFWHSEALFNSHFTKLKSFLIGLQPAAWLLVSITTVAT